MEIVKIVAALVAGYLLGSLNTSVIVGRLYGKDISRHGSKNAGLTNTLRVLGKPAAALVLDRRYRQGRYCLPGRLGPRRLSPGPAGQAIA